MKKTFLKITTLMVLAGAITMNCSKKEDPAPAATTSGTTTSGTTTSGTTTSGTTTSGTTTSGTTTSGTTTSGTTTSGTTTSGTTTSGTTTSGTTTSGTTTSGTTTSGTTTSGTTTSGTTTSGTTAGSTTGTAGTTIGGSGTFSVNGANNIPQIMIQSSGSAAGVDFTSTICQNGNYSVQIMLGNKDLKDGTYSVIPRLSQPKSNEAVIAVVQINNSFQYWSQASGTVTVSGKNMKFNNITLKQYNGDATITISGDYTFK